MKYTLLGICIFIVFIAGCIEKTEIINLSIVHEPEYALNEPSVKVAIASVVSPKESYIYYEDMIKYISRKLGGNVKIVQKKSYEEVNDLLKNNEIDFAFICSGAYVSGKSDSNMKLLVAPQVNGDTKYYSYIIVPANSNYTRFTDLRGKKFAFTDPLSNTGKIYPEYLLSTINETPDSFFGIDETGKKKFFIAYSHDNSIIAVAEQLADGAAVHSIVYEYMRTTQPEVVAKTRIIEVSPPFGIPPIVVSNYIDPFLEEKLKYIFLNMNQDEKGMKILSNINIDKFVIINDSSYDSIREMSIE